MSRRPQGPIRLLTHLRYFGHCFNPVSFYYCFDVEDNTLETIVAEVHNTPWGEEHCYVLGQALNVHPSSDWRRFEFGKSFHVSPFMSMDMRYDWRFRVPGPVLDVHMNCFRDDRKLFDATLKLRKKEMNGKTLTRALLHYPVMTLKVLAMIHWQALKLWNKGAIFYPHP